MTMCSARRAGDPRSGPSPAGPASGGLLGAHLRGNRAGAQFVRFVLVGGTANVLYVGLFLVLAGQGDLTANVAGAVASSALANELHRRLTFAAGARVTWQTAQWEGGLLAVVGVVLSSLALAGWQTVAGEGDPVADLTVIAVVTGGVGLARFAALRWLFDARGERARPAEPVALS